MGLNNLTNNVSSMPSMPAMPNAPSMPGSVADHVAKADGLVKQMQGMSCPQFNPKTPGADKAKELQEHLAAINSKATDAQKSMNDRIADTQNSLNKVCQQPTPDRVKDFQAKAANLQDHVSKTYGDAQSEQQKAANFPSDAQAKAMSEKQIAQQRAMSKVQKQVDDYNNAQQKAAEEQNSAQQKVTDQENNAQQKVTDQENNAQQKVTDQETKAQNAVNNSAPATAYAHAQEKYQAAQQAANDMQNKLPKPPQYPQQPNVNTTVQNWNLPNCPQLSDVQNQLSSLKNTFANLMSISPMGLLLQAVGEMQSKISSLSDQAKSEVEPTIQALEDAITGGAEEDEDEKNSDLIIVNGATGKCSMSNGVPFQVITVPQGSEADGNQMAQPSTVKFTSGALCTSMGNPSTAAANGAPTPCQIAVSVNPEAWAPTTLNTKIANGQPCLIMKSKGLCNYGGVLEFTNPGQDNATASLK